MSVLEDLGHIAEPMQRVWRGIIASNPSSQDDFVDVFLEDFSMELRWKRCKWQPRFEEIEVNVAESGEGSHSIVMLQILYPVRGNPCLCIFDNDRDLWVTTYWPYEIKHI